MAVRMTIVVVPVGAMEGDAALRDVQHPGHTGQVKAIGGNVPGSHVPCRAFMVRDEIPNRGCVSSTQAFAPGRDTRGEDDLSIFVRQ